MQLVDRGYRRFVRFPKPYVELLDCIQQHLVPRTYVEVGVSTGRTLSLALPGTICIGIDPAPKLRAPLGPTSRLFTSTSDDFFAHQDLRSLLEGRPVDLAFIDGLHHFEVALRDFINLERFASSDSVVLIHDCYPIDELTATRERTTAIWSGDIWKLILCLKQWRPDLQVNVADTAPTGLGIVRGLDPDSTVLEESYDRIYEQFIALPFATLDRSKAEMLNRVPGDWNTVRSLLPTMPFRPYNVTLFRGRQAVAGMVAAGRRYVAGRPPKI